jgi:predicted site-specific integrase-resolvase
MALPEITGKRFVSHSQAAKIRGVSGRTLDRWIADGIIPKPEIINKRKYHLIEKIEVISQAQAAA